LTYYESERSAASGLSIAGKWKYVDRIGYNYGYEALYDELADDMEDEEWNSSMATHWPSKYHTGKHHFGLRWYAMRHTILEYRFKDLASPDVTPVFEGSSTDR